MASQARNDVAWVSQLPTTTWIVHLGAQFIRGQILLVGYEPANFLRSKLSCFASDGPGVPLRRLLLADDLHLFLEDGSPHDGILAAHAAVEGAFDLGAEGKFVEIGPFFFGEHNALRGEGLVFHSVETGLNVLNFGLGRVGGQDGGCHAVGAQADRGSGLRCRIVSQPGAAASRRRPRFAKRQQVGRQIEDGLVGLGRSRGGRWEKENEVGSGDSWRIEWEDAKTKERKAGKGER